MLAVVQLTAAQQAAAAVIETADEDEEAALLQAGLAIQPPALDASSGVHQVPAPTPAALHVAKAGDGSSAVTV